MKGGVGKTTTAVHLAAGLAGCGERVLLIDADPQSNVGHGLGLTVSGPTIREVMLGECGPEEAIVPQVRERLDVLPASTHAFALEQQLAGATQRETILARRLEPLSGYDRIVIDTSPSMSLLTFNALLCADGLIVPIGMDPMAIIGARQTMNGVAEVRNLWPDRELEVLAVLPTGVNQATIAARATMEALEADDLLSHRLCRPGIRQCLDLTYAAAARQSRWEYAPRSRAVEDYDGFVRRVRESASAGDVPATDSGH